ncbi:MAG: carbamoyltransferase HypF [Bacteroidetes bacterium]|nr:carbamoyltransferase HypF [Bacteroidota bacterium]
MLRRRVMPENLMATKTFRIHIKGLVQGVGFRPFVYRLAVGAELKGMVENRNDGVIILINATERQKETFLKEIREKAPEASNINSITVTEVPVEFYTDFRIVRSENTSDEITDISPDIAVCKDCLEDMKKQKNRVGYPFINCTNCGPRFTIIRDLPYDRDKTTMEPFVLCDDCRREYTDIMDRRFHAQPVACSICGPHYELTDKEGKVTEINEIIRKTVAVLNNGGIVAMKGMGGYHLACNALDENAVAGLRKRKNREGKPFAVMFRDIDTLKKYAEISPIEESILVSWRRPILLVKDRGKLAPSVSLLLANTGAMLPYMPFHYLLFNAMELHAIVLTSGNISDEPIIISNEAAEKKLNSISDALLTYNRDIYNRIDDSVMKVIAGVPRIFRRSRGFAPAPVALGMNADGIIATGAELVNCFCVGKGRRAILSQHIGDLKNLETLEFFTESLEQYKKLFRITPTLVVCDLHPDYLSTRYALQTGLPVVRIQHHHAHIASCMVEYGLDEKVIGVSFDGTGLGDDGNTWGSEFMVCDLENYRRIAHFEYIPMPGGDKAAESPWRMGIAYLYKVFGRDFLKLKLPFLSEIDNETIVLMLAAIDKKINCPLSSGAGRLFDAVSAITGVCDQATFHAEGPIRLESVIAGNCDDLYSYDMDNVISFDKTIKEIADDLLNGTDVRTISARFHNTIVRIIFEQVCLIAGSQGINKVVLSGGTFQNRYIVESVLYLLERKGLKAFINEKVPANDGGLALGQLAVAAAKRRSGALNI